MNLDMGRAQAYVATSLSGQVSDIAEGARLMEGTAAMEYAEGQILDRLQYLMQMKGTTSYEAGIKYVKPLERAQKVQDLPIPGERNCLQIWLHTLKGSSINKRTIIKNC